MALTVGDIVASARDTLIDTTAVVWSNGDLINYVNGAVYALCNVKNEAYPRRATLALVAGVFQNLPADGIALLEIYQNAVSKMIVNQVGRDLQNASYPAWPANTPQKDVIEFMTDTRDPTQYLVFPPNDGTGSVIALYGALPARYTLVTDPLLLRDSWEHALYSYVLSRAYAKNTLRQDLTKAAAHWGQFATMVGMRSASQVNVSPKMEQAEET